MPLNLGGPELFIVLLIVIVIFGAGRLSEIGGALGRGIREFRTATKDEHESATDAAAGTSKAPTASTTVTASTTPAATTVATAPTAPVGEITCPSCNTVNPASQAFCGQCGTRLARAA